MKIQNIFDLPSLDSTRKSTVGLLAALLLSLFLVGCGGDGGGGNFVATPDTGGAGGGNNTNTGTGSVTFNFVQAQSSPLVVPVGTNRLRFEFFNAADGDGNMVYRVTRDYAAQVTIEDVPTTSRSVVVTAFGADGFPTVQFEADFTISQDEDITISQTDASRSNVTLDELVASPQSLSLGSGGTIRLTLTAVFSSGDRVALSEAHLDEVTFNTSNSSVATVSAGVVSSVSSGTANITATFRGVTATVPVQVNTGPTPPPIATGLSIDPETLPSLPVGSLSEALTITATIQGSGEREVTFNDGLTYISSVAGVTVTNDLKIQIASNVPSGTVATVTFRYLGQTASINVTVVAKTLVDLTFVPSSVSIPFGQFSLPVEIRGLYSDGTDAELPASDFLFTETSSLFSYAVSDDKLIVTSATSGSAGSGVLTVSSQTDPVVTKPLTVSVGSVFVRELLVSPTATTLNPGQAQEFTVTAVFSDDRTVDVTDSGNLQVTLGTGDAGAVLNGTRVVATVPGASRQIRFVYPGTGNGGANVSATATLTVVPVTLTSVKVEFAGKELGNVPVVNLPRGYVGVFEVIGTYSNGSTRRLEANEYRITEDRETLAYNPDPNGAVELFDDTYSIPRANDTGLGDAGDLVFNQRTETTSGSRSTRNAFLVKDSFRAVVADWRRYEPVETGGTVEVDVVVNEEVGGGETSVIGGNIGNFDLFKIEVLDADGDVIDSLTRKNIQVAVVDPIGVVTVASGAYANRPTDPNLLIGTPREFDVLVDFQVSQAEEGENEIDPPTYSPPAAEIKNFKLAEANLLFVNDIAGGNPNLVSHRPTPIGLPALFVNNAVQVTNLEVSVVPIGGFGGRVVPISATERLYAYDTFGPATAVNPEFPDGGFKITYDYFAVDNQGAGFDIVVASVLTLEPVLSPFNLPVGAGQYFRTIAIYGAGQSPVDVSLDYRPIVTSGEGDFVISESSVDTGVILVNGIAAGSAVVQALDVDGNQVPARSQGSYTDIYGNVGTPTTRVDINVTAP